MSINLCTAFLLLASVAWGAEPYKRRGPYVSNATESGQYLIPIQVTMVTNTHWTLLETKPSNYGCLVLGCNRDHSEMRIERKDSWIITTGDIGYQGKTNHITLKCEPIVGTETRTQYSGVDYEKCDDLWKWRTSGWLAQTNFISTNMFIIR